MEGKNKMVCRTLELYSYQLSSKTGGRENQTTEEGNKMRDKFGSVAFNLRNALWRVEDLRQEVEREVNKKLRHNIYEIQSSVNNLMGIVKLGNENLNELEALLKEPNVKKDGTLKNGAESMSKRKSKRKSL